MAKKMSDALGEKIIVLYVDDDDLNRSVACDMLSVAGASMIGVSSARRGIELLQQSHFDVVLMDLRMSEMDGLTAIQFIRNIGFDKIPIIVVTADISIDIRERCLEAGADDIIFKPIAMESLFSSIGQALAKNCLAM